MMFTIDTVVAALLIGATLGTLLGHLIGYGKGKRRGKAAAIIHIRAVAARGRVARRKPRRTTDQEWDDLEAEAARKRGMEWAAWNA